jgi:mannose-1-phosphate guanylyltransferase
MLPVGHAPILQHIVGWLGDNGVKDIVISTGYLGNAIESYFKDGSEFGLRIEYASSRRPLGIAGQLRSAEDKLGERFVCLYGDAILNFDLRELLDFHDRKKAMLTMALMEHSMQNSYGVIDLARDGAVERWNEKPVVQSQINVGCYVMQKRYLEYIPRDSVYGMKEAFEKAMANHERLYGLKVSGEFYDIGDKKAYKEADALFSKLQGKIP